ncbi:MAG: cellulose biosynthesis cyclic di-GMP-binding regulatory protein BcsB, partial [Ignavibacteria bacterium]|nr:cellulose biosynthesis cyclic di-GMP-binding regulatory protein BcsB [Ignavibacteria bacterium]
MNKRPLFFIVILQLIFLTNVKNSFAAEVKEYTLRDIGFQKDIVLYGISPAQTLFFPIPSNADFSRSYFELHYAFSSILRELSVIRVSVNDVPVYSEHFNKSQTNPVIRISLADVKMEDLLALEKPLLKIEVGGYLNITDDRCRDLATQALWMVIKQDSKLSLAFTSDQSKNYIADFFTGKMISPLVLVPKNMTTNIGGAAVWVNTRLLEHAKNNEISYDTFEEFEIGKINSHDNVVIVGQLANLMSLPIPLALSKDDLINKYRLDITADDGILLTKSIGDTKILYVVGESPEGLQKAAGTIVNPKHYSRLLVNYALIRYIEPFKIKTLDGNKYRMTLDELGYEKLQTKGIGSLRITIYFSELDLAKSIGNVDFYLYSKYTPVQQTFPNGFLNLYLNDVLVESKRLDATGTFNGLYVTLPKYLFKKVNTFDIEFNYFPDEGECRDDLTQFVGEIYSYSHFDVTTGE